MKAWQEFLNTLSEDLGVDTVNRWLRTLRVINFDACNLYLEAKDAFQILWFEEHVRSKVQKLLINNNRKVIRVHLVLPDKQDVSASRRGKMPRGKKGGKVASSNNVEKRQSYDFDELDPSCTFDAFVPSGDNMLAYKLLCELAGYDYNLGKLGRPMMELASFNPIYIYGPAGVGKTHLLMAAATLLREHKLKVVYFRAETFIDHVVRAMRSGVMPDFRKTYRDADVFIVDDVSLFARKSACQEELFHTFNTLHQDNKQIILSSTVYPQGLQFIEPRLISRFEWGIAVPIDGVKQEDMAAVVLNKAKMLNFDIGNDVINFLCDNFGTNTEALSKALKALVLRMHLQDDSDQPLDLSRVRSLLGDLIDEEKRAVLTSDKLVQVVAEFYGIPLTDLLGKSQSRECAWPRQVAMHLCRLLLKMPYMKIGDLFSRNHSTVMTSVKQVQRKIDLKDPDLLVALSGIQDRLRQERLPK